MKSNCRNILLTGKPGIGKTTIIQKVIERCPLITGGFITREIRKNGRRMGFSIDSIRSRHVDKNATPEDILHGILAHVDSKSPHRLGRYGVNVTEMERVGLTAMKEAVQKAQIIVIDEIGKMELYSPLFQKEIIRILDCALPLVGVIQQRRTPFLDTIRSRTDVSILNVLPDNRDGLPFTILDLLDLSRNKYLNSRTV